MPEERIEPPSDCPLMLIWHRDDGTTVVAKVEPGSQSMETLLEVIQRLVFYGRYSSGSAVIYGEVIAGHDEGMFGRWPVDDDDLLAVRNHLDTVAAAIALDVER